MLRRGSLTINKPHVLILHEHHGNRYLLVQSEEDLYRLALEILDWRFGGEKDNHGYYVLEKPEEPSKSEILDDEEIKKLPAFIRGFAQAQQKTLKQEIVSYRREKEQYDAVHEVLLKKDGGRAWKILQAMSSASGEDDEIDLIPLETAYIFA